MPKSYNVLGNFETINKYQNLLACAMTAYAMAYRLYAKALRSNDMDADSIKRYHSEVDFHYGNAKRHAVYLRALTGRQYLP